MGALLGDPWEPLGVPLLFLALARDLMWKLHYLFKELAQLTKHNWLHWLAKTCNSQVNTLPCEHVRQGTFL